MMLTEVLRRAGLGDREDIIAAAVEDAISTLERSLEQDTDWSKADEALLRRGGLDPSPASRREREAWMADAAAEYASLVSTSLSVHEAAQRLKVDASRIRQRLTDGSLFGFKVRRQWRIPAWQFIAGREVVGLSDLLVELKGWEPVAATNFVTSPNVDLMVGETLYSPLQWVLEGRPVETVARLAANFARS
jgi:excisionase family DNA binding protein